MLNAGELRIESRAGFTILRPSSSLVLTGVEALPDALNPILRTEAPPVVIDLADVTLIGSRMIGFLMASRARAEERKGRFILANLTPQVMEILQAYSLDKVFSIVTDLEELLARSEAYLEREKESDAGRAAPNA